MARRDTTGAVEPGVYHLSFVCVGTGTVRVFLGVPDAPAGPDLASDDVQCSDAGASLVLIYPTTVAVDLSVQVEGLPGADAGYAYRLWRS
jgi:hypothetical protein